MKEIALDKVKHKGQAVVLIKFPFDRDLINIVKMIDGATWSKTLNSWYAPYNKGVLIQLKNELEMQCTIDTSLLKLKLAEEKKEFKQLNELSDTQKEKLIKYIYWLRSKRYSESTIGTYSDALKTFFRFYSTKPINEITNEDIIRFNNEYILRRKFSASFQNQVVNAIKLFFGKIENTKIDIASIHRPKRAKVLPNVLSKDEIKRILNVHRNVKHKAMLSLVYACGLRRSELLNLKLGDIDSKRGLVMIRQAKGKKDRIIPLPGKILELLRQYFVAYKPVVWLFEGQDKENKYNENSLSAVLKQAVLKCNIKKPVSLHWLRHSYATHLLENGTDLRYIQEILGHSRSTTTEIYTHVSNKSIQRVISPFETL